jgi:hypothetical protein
MATSEMHQLAEKYLGVENVKGTVVMSTLMHRVGRQTSDFTYIPNFFHYSKYLSATSKKT